MPLVAGTSTLTNHPFKSQDTLSRNFDFALGAIQENLF